MKNFTLIIILSLLIFKVDAQIKRIVTTPTAIASEIPGYSQVTTITTKTFPYTIGLWRTNELSFYSSTP
jgi:hypothetical protein